MTTLKEIMAADMVDVFLDSDDFGGSVNIDGVDVDAILGPNEADSADFEGGIEERRSLLMAPGTLDPLPVSDQELLVDGERVMVTTVTAIDSAVKLSYVRYRS